MIFRGSTLAYRACIELVDFPNAYISTQFALQQQKVFATAQGNVQPLPLPVRSDSSAIHLSTLKLKLLVILVKERDISFFSAEDDKPACDSPLSRTPRALLL